MDIGSVDSTTPTGPCNNMINTKRLIDLVSRVAIILNTVYSNTVALCQTFGFPARLTSALLQFLQIGPVGSSRKHARRHKRGDSIRRVSPFAETGLDWLQNIRDVLSASALNCSWLLTGVQSGFRANYALIKFSSDFFALQTSGVQH